MSPLKIIALLGLHCSTAPFQFSPAPISTSRAMREAYEDFARDGLLANGVTHQTALDERPQFLNLSDKGEELVRRICGVEP